MDPIISALSNAFRLNMNEHDDHLMSWESYAQEAIETLMNEVQYDNVRGTVTLPNHDARERKYDVDFFSAVELEEYFRDVYRTEWCNYVPFDGGEIVFEDDAWGAVENLLAGNKQLHEFFENHENPEDSDQIVTAHDLVLNFEASKVLRITFEEINEELIQYLAANPEKMRELSPRKFEELVADMFHNQGFSVTLTPSVRDGGMDVIAVQKNGIGTVMVIVECKRYAIDNKVGVEIVRGLYGVVEQKRATRGIIATTSYFTKGAKEFRNDLPYRIGLADFDNMTTELEEWKLRITRERNA